MSDMSLSEAMDIVESFGYRIVNKDRIKKLSYHIAITKNEYGMSSLTEEEILDIHARKVDKSIAEQLAKSEALKHTTEEKEMVKYHHYNLYVIV